MAKTIASTSPVQTFNEQLAACTTTQERLALYRAAARHVAPAPAATTMAERVGKLGATSMNFFSNTAAVYRIERELGKM